MNMEDKLHTYEQERFKTALEFLMTESFEKFSDNIGIKVGWDDSTYKEALEQAMLEKANEAVSSGNAEDLVDVVNFATMLHHQSKIVEMRMGALKAKGLDV